MPADDDDFRGARRVEREGPQPPMRSGVVAAVVVISIVGGVILTVLWWVWFPRVEPSEGGSQWVPASAVFSPVRAGADGSATSATGSDVHHRRTGGERAAAQALRSAGLRV